MGVVYEAEELASGRRVALKILPAELSASGEALERFRREARFAAAISDTHCVFVYGAHEVEGSPAISMELCGSETLEDRIRAREPVPIRTAVGWMIEVLDGLEAAHRAGVLHRDVKPSNCFLGPDGRVKIGDFGLARTLERDVHLTQSGAFLGSPLYASPEQVRGREIDLRSDLYSCGATLSALLTGTPPFSGQNLGEVLARILSESPPKPRSIRPEIPRALERVVLRAMAKDPRRRFRDHAGFRAALQGFVSEAPPGNMGWRFVASVIDLAAGVGIYMVLAIGLWFASARSGHFSELPSAAFALSGYAGVFLVLALCEGCFGATFGKWLMGQRVVAVSTGHRSFPRAALRAGVFMSPFVLVQALRPALLLATWTSPYIPFVIPFLIVLAFLATLRRRNGYRAVHELASGTRVIQVPPVFARRLRPATASSRRPEPEMGLPGTVGTCQVEGVIGRTPLGPLMRGRDPGLGRTVWIQAYVESPGPALDHARRSLARVGRLRWLHSHTEQGVRYEVFEDPGGAGFSDMIRAGLDWPQTYRFLLALAEELSEGNPASSGFAGRGVCLEQLWIDRTGNLRVLDEPIGSGPFRSVPPLEFLGETARTMCLGSGATGLPPDLPHHAEGTMRRICGLGDLFGSVDAAHSALAALSSRPTALARRIRVTQIAAATIASTLTLFFMVTAWLVTVSNANQSKHQARLHRLLRSDFSSAVLQDGGPEDAEDRRARLTLISYYSQPWASKADAGAQIEGREIMDEALRLVPHPTTAEVRVAAERLAPRVRAGGLALEDIYEDAPNLRGPLGRSLVAWVALSMVLAFLLRGGLSLRLFGMDIRDRRGERASRLRCAGRALILGSPLVAFVLALALLPTSSGSVLAPLALALMAVFGLGLVWSVWSPTRGPHDLIAGTRLVPR